MITMASSDARRYLKKFHDKLFDNLVIYFKKLVQNSVLLTILEKQSTKIIPILISSTLDAATIPSSIREELLSEDLIMETSLLGKLAITGRGVWFVETYSHSISESALIDFINTKYFLNVSLSVKPLNEREKVVILTLLAGRAFNEEWPVDLRHSDRARDAWLRVLKDSCALLRELKIIELLSPDEFSQKKSLEHPILDVLRHMNNLSTKTKSVFQMFGDRKYFLKVFDRKLDENKIKFLFQLTFDSTKFSASDLDKISSFLEATFARESIFLFKDPETSPFLSHGIGVQIRDALIMYET